MIAYSRLTDTGTFFFKTNKGALTTYKCPNVSLCYPHVCLWSYHLQEENFWTVKLNCLPKERAGTLGSRLSAEKTTAGAACLGMEWRTGWVCDSVCACVMEPGGDKLPRCIPNSTWKFSVSTQVCMCDGEISWKIPHVALRQRKLQWCQHKRSRFKFEQSISKDSLTWLQKL